MSCVLPCCQFYNPVPKNGIDRWYRNYTGGNIAGLSLSSSFIISQPSLTARQIRVATAPIRSGSPVSVIVTSAPMICTLLFSAGLTSLQARRGFPAFSY